VQVNANRKPVTSAEFAGLKTLHIPCTVAKYLEKKFVLNFDSAVDSCKTGLVLHWFSTFTAE